MQKTYPCNISPKNFWVPSSFARYQKVFLSLTQSARAVSSTSSSLITSATFGKLEIPQMVCKPLLKYLKLKKKKKEKKENKRSYFQMEGRKINCFF